MRPTLKQVSTRAGVSVFTASRALAHEAGVAKETRKRVFDAAAHLGYVPNIIARNLKGAKTRTIGVLTANSANQFYAYLVGAIQREVLGDGYTCFVSDAVDNGAYSIERETAFIAALLQQRVAGLVLTYVPTEATLALLKSWRMPTVFVDCTPPIGFEDHSSVVSDGFAAAYDVGLRLSRNKRRNWLFVGHTAAWSTREAREEGFRKAALECGAALNVIEGGNDSATAFRLVSEYFRGIAPASRPNALFATNEPLLNGSLRTLRDLGMSVPDEIAVVSYDDFDWADQLVPPISVVDQQIEKIGSIAARTLLEELSGIPPDGRRTTLPVTFIQRKSCGS